MEEKSILMKRWLPFHIRSDISTKSPISMTCNETNKNEILEGMNMKTTKKNEMKENVKMDNLFV